MWYFKIVCNCFLFLGFNRFFSVFLGKVVKVLLVGVKIVKGFLLFKVFMSLLVCSVEIRVVKDFVVVVVLMMFLGVFV